MLRGLGATLALPFLDSMVPALTALSKTAAAPVRRFGVFYVPNGMSMPYWSPKAEGMLNELPPTLQSLAEFKDQVLLCGGLADEAANLVKGGEDYCRCRCLQLGVHGSNRRCGTVERDAVVITRARN